MLNHQKDRHSFLRDEQIHLFECKSRVCAEFKYKGVVWEGFMDAARTLFLGHFSSTQKYFCTSLTLVRTQENYVPLWFVLKNKKKQTLILHLTYVYSFIVVFTTTITDISQQNSCVRVSAAGV